MAILHTESPTQFFQRQITRAMDRQRVSTSTASAGYLVELLESFVCPHRLFARIEVDPEQPLAEVFCVAVGSEGSRKLTLLKFSGDMSLFISGIFSDSLSRKPVGVGFYIQLGGSAYATAAASCRSDQAALLFTELAMNFTRFVEVLNEVSESCSLTDRTNLLRLYETCIESGSLRSERILRQQGIPVSPSSFDQIH